MKIRKWKKQKNIDHSNNTYKEMKKKQKLPTTTINRIPKKNRKYLKHHHRKDIHSKQLNQASVILKNGNTMIELDGLGSATESFSDEIIMSPYPESNFPRVSISNEVSNYKVQPQNRSLKMCDKLEDNTEYLEKSAAFTGKTFHKFLEEAIKC